MIKFFIQQSLVILFFCWAPLKDFDSAKKKEVEIEAREVAQVANYAARIDNLQSSNNPYKILNAIIENQENKYGYSSYFEQGFQKCVLHNTNTAALVSLNANSEQKNEIITKAQKDILSCFEMWKCYRAAYQNSILSNFEAGSILMDKIAANTFRPNKN